MADIEVNLSEIPNTPLVADRFHDGGTIRLADCHAEHGTITAHTMEIGEPS